MPRRRCSDVRANDELRCVVVTGTGDAFCAGQDLGEMAEPPAHDNPAAHGYRGFMPLLEDFDKPLLAAVNGVGVGIGLTMLPYCDLVLMAESARLRAPFVTLGVTTEAASSVSLASRMGWQAAAHLVFTAAWLSASEAVEHGLAWKVCPDDSVLDETMEIARVIGAMPVTSLTTTKRLMVAGRLDTWRAARHREDHEFPKLVGSPENLAALDRFLRGNSTAPDQSPMAPSRSAIRSSACSRPTETRIVPVADAGTPPLVGQERGAVVDAGWVTSGLGAAERRRPAGRSGSPRRSACPPPDRRPGRRPAGPPLRICRLARARCGWESRPGIAHRGDAGVRLRASRPAAGPISACWRCRAEERAQAAEAVPWRRRGRRPRLEDGE